MLYYGYFRDINTNIDPKGQLYKVEIITDLNNPYPYQFNPYDIDNPIPEEGAEITMCSQPFIVSYEGENNNIYKSHKCSTATIKFLMSSFNSDLFATYNKKILVSLLKWKNNIKLVGDNYVDENDNVICRKHSYQISQSEAINRFIPSEVDKKCYSVEWIGFATPNCYNQDYSLVEQEFTYEVQDGYSTLENKKWELNNELEVSSIDILIRRLIGSLGVYKHIYIQDTLKTDTLGEITNVIQQWRNWENKTYLEILDEVLNYLNLSAIPFRDSVYIIDSDGVAGEHQYFINEETTGNPQYYFNYNNTWINRGLSLIGNTIRLEAKNYCSNDTNISLEEVIDGVELTTDSNDIKLIPNTLKDKNYKYWTVLDNRTTLYSDVVSSFLGHNYTNKVYWEKGTIIQLQNYAPDEGIKTYIYNKDSVVGTSVSRSHVELDIPTFNLNFIKEGTDNTKVGCVLLQNSEFTKEYTEEGILTREARTRDTIKYPNNFGFFGETHHEGVTDVDFRQWWFNNDQIVLSLTTPKFVFNKRNNLQLKGDWTFFRNMAFSYFEKTDNERNSFLGGDENKPVYVEKQYLYISCRIKLELSSANETTTYWLMKNYNVSPNNTDYNYAYSYRWVRSDFPVVVDIYLSDDIDKEKPFGQIFTFGDRNKGFVRSFPNIGNQADSAIGKLYIDILRPLGCAVRSDNVPVFANSTKLENFEVNIIDSSEEINYEDITYKTKGENTNPIELKSSLISQPYFKKSKWGVTIMNTGEYKNTRLFKISTGLTDIPEKLKISDYFKQYNNQTLRLNTSIFKLDNLTPATCIKTNQFSGYNFVVDTQEIDYELNNTTLSLVRKHTANSIPKLDISMYINDNNGLVPVINPLWNDGVESDVERNGVFSIESDSAIHSTTPERIWFEPYFTEEGIIAKVTNGENDVEIEVNINNELIIRN